MTFSRAFSHCKSFNCWICGGLLTTDAEGRILVLNRAGAEIAGAGLGLLRGERIDKLVGMMRGPSGSRVRLTIRRPGEKDPRIVDLVGQCDVELTRAEAVAKAAE